MKTLKNYGLITLSTFIVAVGVYFFKFPNNFCFGGVTGGAVVIANLTPISASLFTTISNILLLLVGFLFLGKDFAIKTGYSSLLLSLFLMLLEHFYPMTASLSNEPLLELIFAITLPAVGSAILFHIGASSGGTDVLAMLLKKYTNVHIGTALFIIDLLIIIVACFVFDIRTALYSFVGLIFKSFMIDDIIERINLCKSFTIICDHPDIICDYIVNVLDKSATVTEATGAYTNHKKYIIITVLRRNQAVLLRQFIHETEPGSFMLISNTSEIIGKGFFTI